MVAGVKDGLYTAFRDSLVGELIYNISGRKILTPPIYRNDYKIDPKYLAGSTIDRQTIGSQSSSAETKDASSTQVVESGDIIVSWDSDDDPENPNNWSSIKKTIITLTICFLTTSVYMASVVFTPAEDQMLEFFGCTQVKLMLGVTIFVWGYGIGPMFVSAMSESPLFGGRRYILVIGQIIFVAMQIPTALSNHLASFVVLRLLAGLTASPPLCVGPATLGDMFAFPSSAYIIVAFAVGAVCGPFFGPLIGAALTHANSWRWAFWYLLIQGGVALVLMLFFLPETSGQAILMRKAKRLRQITGNPNIKAPGDILKAEITFRAEAVNILWLPIDLCIREPVLDLVNVHLSLLYAVIYLFFEGFPIVFQDLYGFTIVEVGLAYIGIMVGNLLAVVVYLLHLNRNLIKPIMEGRPKTPESVFGTATLAGSIIVTIGLFVFGWSASPKTHWMGPVVGGALFAFGTFFLFQAYIAYINKLYPTRFASALASSNVMRALVGGAFPLFGVVYYKHTGTKNFPVGWGSSILGFVALAMVLLPVYFLKYGGKLREKTLRKYGALE